MIVVFDLDYTLLRTERLKPMLAQALGTSPEDFAQDTKRFFKERGRHYSLREHARARGVVDWDGWCQGLKRDIFHQRSELLFEEALPMLETCRRLRARVELMTRGDAEFQEFKVAALGLSAYFDDAIFLEGSKTDAVRRYQRSGEAVVFVNDNRKELIGMLSAAPMAKGILVSGPYSEGEDADGLKVTERKEALAKFLNGSLI